MKIALIGYGYWGPNVAKQLHNNNNIDFDYICDKKHDRLQKAKSVYINQVKYTLDFNEVISDPSIQAVCLAVETSAHFELAKKALHAGKHVYVEKPFTATVAEAVELQRIAKELNLIIHVDHIMIYHPYIRKIKELIDSGKIGDILYIDAERVNLGQIKKDVSSMWDLAVHDLSIIEYLTNGPKLKNITVLGEKYYNPKESITFLSLRYENFIAHIKSNWISPLKERKIVVAGTKKMIVFDDMRTTEKLMIYDKGVDIISGKNIEYDDYVVKTRTGDIVIPYVKEQDALYNSVNHFVTCIEKNIQSDSGPEAALRVIQVLENADKAMS